MIKPEPYLHYFVVVVIDVIRSYRRGFIVGRIPVSIAG